MVRTQISLLDSQKLRLDQESKRTGRSISDLIRGAVERSFPPVPDADGAISIIRATAGAWEARSGEDDVDGTTYVERIRVGRRLS